MHNSAHIISSKHYLVLCSIAFTLGIFLFVYLDNIVLTATVIFLAVALFSLSVILLLRTFKLINTRLKPILLPFFSILFVLLGIFRIYCFENSSSAALRRYESNDVWLYGCVTSAPELTSSGFYRSFELEVVQVNSDPKAKGTVLMYLPTGRCENLEMGDQICCWTKLSIPDRTEANDNFDYYTHLRGKNIFVIGNTQNVNKVYFDKSITFTSYIRNIGISVRSKISKTVDCIFLSDASSRSVLKGILLGDKSEFSDELYKRFSNAGISHIIAVSGLHLSILFSFIMSILSTTYIRRKTALIIAMPLILLFVSASAFSLSVCRAALMLFIAILAVFTGKRYDSATALFLALGIILIISPYSLFSKSLLLSFSATLGIFAFYKYIMHILLKPFRTNFKPFTFVASSLSLSSSSLIGTLYFLILFFGSISKVQFLTNLWTIPLVSVIFCLGFIVCLVYELFPAFALWALKPPLSLLLNIIKTTVDVFGDDKYALNIPINSMPNYVFPIYVGFVVMLYFFLKLYYDIDKEKKRAAKKSAAQVY